VVNPKRVLVAFSSRSGSTAGTAEEIAAVLRTAGLSVDCRSKEEVADVTPYQAVILGSGMFVASRSSDGGGFLAHHGLALRDRDLWLYSAGPIGGHATANGDASAVVAVGRAVGARGVAAFGVACDGPGCDPVTALMPADRREVRSWAARIAADLGAPVAPPRARHNRCHGAMAAS
jgi:menaquinone-dependent protoporphyrinogen oxidase